MTEVQLREMCARNHRKWPTEAGPLIAMGELYALAGEKAEKLNKKRALARSRSLYALQVYQDACLALVHAEVEVREALWKIDDTVANLPME